MKCLIRIHRARITRGSSRFQCPCSSTALPRGAVWLAAALWVSGILGAPAPKAGAQCKNAGWNASPNKRSTAQYASNPFSFSIPEPVAGDPNLEVIGDQFFAADVNGDGLLDYTFRSWTALYVYDHDGTPIWNQPVTHPSGNGGSKHAAADLDGDGQVEIAALNASDQILIFDGSDGTLERTVTLTDLGENRMAGHIAVANLRGAGDRDLIVQTQDERLQGSGYYYYINRSLIALNVESDPAKILWTVEQDANTEYPQPAPAGIYEGYWGQAHGPFLCADVDGDGLDEVAGATLVDDDGQVISMGYPSDWIVSNGSDFIDHLDAIALGDFKPDLPGLEWVMSEEDWLGGAVWNNWHTTMLSAAGILWRKECDIWPDGSEREPQNVAVGDFNTGREAAEVWARSRLGNSSVSQHPWLFDNTGNQYTHFSIDTALPAGFNTSPDGGNKNGIEMIWTIDWDGPSSPEYIAAKARYVLGNIGVFNAENGEAVWATPHDFGAVTAAMVYVADVSGDSREEVVVYDSLDGKIKIYWNEASNPSPGPNKWDDPLYRRLKQQWNYYSPGSYTRRDPLTLGLKIFLEGAYDTTAHAMRGTLDEYQIIPAVSPYVEDPRVAYALPEDVVDWVLVQLRSAPNGPPVYTRSAFIEKDGHVVMEGGDAALDLFAEKGSYYIVVRHRNHLAVMSREKVDFSGGSADYDFSQSADQYYGEDGGALLESGVYGMIAGDANGSGIISNSDKDPIIGSLNQSGYMDCDTNLSGIVTYADKDYIVANLNRASQVQY